MITAVSLYGLITSLLLNVKSTKLVATILRKALLWTALLFPLVILTVSQIYFYLPFASIVAYRLLFSPNKNELLEFFIIFTVVMASLNNSLLWILVTVILFKFAIFILLERSSKQANGLRFEASHVFEIILLSLATVFMILSQTYPTSNFNMLLSSFISLLFLLFYTFKSIGVLGPIFLQELSNDLSVHNRLLLDVISMFIIPVSLVPAIDRLMIPLTKEYMDYILLSLIFIYALMAYINLKVKKSNFSYFLRFTFATTFMCNLLSFLFITEFDYNSLMLTNFISFSVYGVGTQLDKMNIAYKKFTLIIVTALILPTFLNPLFYGNIWALNSLLNQTNYTVGLFFLVSILFPILFIKTPIERIIKCSNCVKLNKVDMLQIIYWVMLIIMAYVAVYYG